ncbi:MAG: prolyl oligopeptidase family serine peptidase [Prolixibacteraceae bacterium]|jgi:dienelactone hydrolase|nr:prolyl oligopeptidase family serine peptidase [Prolixibacteraceae bacterium]
MRKRLTFLLVLVSIGLFAQELPKRIIGTDDFAGWKTIRGTKISNNGKTAGYELNPQRGDGVLIIKQLETKQEDTIPRGYDAAFSPESDYIVFRIKQPLDSIRKAKMKELEKEEMPKDSLGIFVFKNHTLVKFPNLKSYAVPEKNGGWIAFMTEKPGEGRETGKKQKGTPGKGEDGEKEKHTTGDLILYHAKNGDTLRYHDVSRFYYSKGGASIALIQETGDPLKTARVSVVGTSTQKRTEIFSGQGTAKEVSMDDAGGQFAFLFSNDTTKQKAYSLFFGSIENGLSGQPVSGETKGMPIGWSVSESCTPYFSEDGARLFFGTARSPAPEPKDTLPDDEKIKVDVWNWQDRELQPQQKINLDKEKKRSYLAVLHLKENKFIQLGDPVIREIQTTLKGNGPYALGKDIVPYQRTSSWTGEHKADYYLVDIKTGIKRKIADGMEDAWISPGGNFVVWYDPADSSYYSRSTNIESRTVNQLTKKIPVLFCDEQHDMPSSPRPYGISGWAAEDRSVYIYDRFDIWKIDPTAMKVPMNVTRSFGRRNQLRLRYVKLDPEQEFIRAENVNIVRSFDERSKAYGFFEADFKNFKEPGLLVAEDKLFGIPLKARESDRILFTKESCSEFPDLWVSNLKFEKPRKISDANPQQKQYNWTFTNLVKWLSFNGEELQGMLYLPEDFNPRLKYPVVVYYYERNSDNLFKHHIPSPSRSVINYTYYASNGYLVFVPDIIYRTGYPGQSAYDAVVSGVNYLINNFSFVDAEKIGLQGQSWGGYQTAFIVTRTNQFAAAMAGAPVSNMTSAYGGIRWETGLSRMFQYERTQSRMGGTLWEKPLLYIENSPLFHAPKVHTPLLMMHNDNDGAVPWYQGIEFFVALRRLNKPVWLLNYNGEPHNLKAESWGNRMDLTIRMKGFFDHYLKGKPMPEWMRFGVPALDKGEKTGY